MTGIERIAAERKRQIETEGWTPKHDTQHSRGEISKAASCYARVNWSNALYTRSYVPRDWPWESRWWKPSADRIRNLEKAGALIAAEIDRLLALRGASEQPAETPSDPEMIDWLWDNGWIDIFDDDGKLTPRQAIAGEMNRGKASGEMEPNE